MKRLFSASIAALAILAIGAGGAYADDDDSEHEGYQGCKIETVAVSEDHMHLTITGQNLMRHDYDPKVVVSGMEWYTDSATDWAVEAHSDQPLDQINYVVNLIRSHWDSRSNCAPFEITVHRDVAIQRLAGVVNGLQSQVGALENQDKTCSGTSSDWHQLVTAGVNIGIYNEFDISSCGFDPATAKVFATVVGDAGNGLWHTTGPGSVYRTASPNVFQVYVRMADGSPLDVTKTPTTYHWAVNYLVVGQPALD